MNPMDTATLVALLSGGEPGASKTPDLINQYIQSDSILPPSQDQSQQQQPPQAGLLGSLNYGMLGQVPPGQGMLSQSPNAGY